MLIGYAEGALLSWRHIAWLNITFIVVPNAIIHFWVPESPVWLVSKGRDKEATESLRFLLKASSQDAVR